MASETTSRATLVLKANGLIAHYTDTVLGFACLPKENLLQRLARVKHRPSSKGFILLASSSQQLSRYVNCSSAELAKVDLPQPNPTTWLVNSSDAVPPSLLGTSNKIAVRLSNNPGVTSICKQVGAIVSTSANLSGQAICTDISTVRKIFGPNIDYVHLAEDMGTHRPSTVIDLESGKIIRE